MTSPVDLRDFDLYPFPLQTAVHWTDKGFEIELLVVIEVRDDGYSSIPIATHAVPYKEGHPPEQGSAELDAALGDAWRVFAERLAQALADRATTMGGP